MNKAEYALTDYKVGKELAHGGFGYVFSGEAKDGSKVALKYERTYERISRPYLQYEAAVYRVLEGGDPCVPRVHAYGREVRWNIMVTDLLGTSLETLLDKCGDSFSLKTMLMLAPQMIDCVQYVHSKGVLHRDIKPDNFLMGLPGTERENKVHIVDFGLARRYTHPKTGKHLPRTDGHSFFGTKRFASLAALDGKTQGRKDDLESVSYSLIYFLRDHLPWQGLRGGTDKHRDMRVREKKRSWTAVRLCEGLPGEEELTKMLDYVRNLNYEDEPDYEMLKNLFYDRLKKEGWTMDYDYDWKSLEHDPSSSSSSSSSAPPSASSRKNNAGTEAFPKPPAAVDGDPPKEESAETVEIKTNSPAPSPAPAVFNPDLDKQPEVKPSDTTKPVGEAPALDAVQEEDEDADDEKSTAADYFGRRIDSSSDEEQGLGEEEGAPSKRQLPTPEEAYIRVHGEARGEDASPADKPGMPSGEKPSASVENIANSAATADVSVVVVDDDERSRLETNETAFFTADNASVASAEDVPDANAAVSTSIDQPVIVPSSHTEPAKSEGHSVETTTKVRKDTEAADPPGVDDKQPADVVAGAAKDAADSKAEIKPEEPANGEQANENVKDEEKNDKGPIDDDDDDDDDDASHSSFSIHDTPLKRGDVVLAKLFARKTLEYDSDNGSEPSDTSYWHNPNLSHEEWKFKYRPGVVTDIQEGDFGYLKVYLLPLMAREDGLERVALPRRQAFIPLKGENEENATSASPEGVEKDAGSGSSADEKSESHSKSKAKVAEESSKVEVPGAGEGKVASEKEEASPEENSPPLGESENVENASSSDVNCAQVDKEIPKAAEGPEENEGKLVDSETAKEAVDEKSSSKPEEKEHGVVVEASPSWPLKGSYIHHQYCSFRVNVRPEDTQDIEVKWRLTKEDFKRLQSVRSTVFDSLKNHEPYSEDEKETAEVRWRQRKRAGIRSYPIFGELASVTEESFKDPGVIWTGSTGWLPEFQKIDKRRDKENRSEIGSEANHYSDLDDEDENVSDFTGGAPGNRRMSCTLDIGDSEMDSDDFDDFSAMESLLTDEEDDMSSIRSEDTRRSDNSSRVSRASPRSSGGSSKSERKRPKMQAQKSLRRNILKEAARVAMNANWTTDEELDSDPELTSPVTPSESVVSTVPPSLVASDASLDASSSRVDSTDASSSPSDMGHTDDSSARSAQESDASVAVVGTETPVTSDSADGGNSSRSGAEDGTKSVSSSSDDSVRYTRSQKGKWKAIDTDNSSNGTVDTSDSTSFDKSDESASGDDDSSSPSHASEDSDLDSVVDSVDDAAESDSDSDSEADASNSDSSKSEFLEGSAGSARHDSDDVAEDATESSVEENDSDTLATPIEVEDNTDEDKENEAPSTGSDLAPSEHDKSTIDGSATAEQDEWSVQSNFGSSSTGESRLSASDVLDIPYMPPPQPSAIAAVATPPPPPPSTGGSVIVDDGGYNRQSSQATRKVMIDRATQTDQAL